MNYVGAKIHHPTKPQLKRRRRGTLSSRGGVQEDNGHHPLHNYHGYNIFRVLCEHCADHFCENYEAVIFHDFQAVLSFTMQQCCGREMGLPCDITWQLKAVCARSVLYR
eukprot:scaffold609_cov198-Alexandrium_tamarense.AAC.5